MGGSFTAEVALLVVICVVNHVHGERVATTNGCDLFQGSWIRDESFPFYNSSQCPFIEKQFDCEKNGRSDTDYLKYGWQPTHCNLPRFDAREFLLRMKGKKVMFIGDSLGLNQWQSLTCMLHVGEPTAKYISQRSGPVSNFTFPKYNVSFFLFRDAFLVDLVTENGQRVLKLDSFSNGTQWKEMDVLIFDSWHWWLHSGRKQNWDIVVSGNTTFHDGDRISMYERALHNWAKWVETQLDTTKTKVFFQGVSPDHDSLESSKSQTCTGVTQPTTILPGQAHIGEQVLENVLKTVSKQVYLLNITTMSQFRQDGHPSVFGQGGHRALDCTHWCLPGVPDTWNQLLYTALLTQS